MQPKYLNSKSQIYLVAPSFGCATSPYKERLTKAIPRLEKLGHHIIVGKNCFLNLGTCASNTPRERAQEFMEAYQSSADCIISVGGGEMMTEILDYIDFDLIKTLKPKWFVGFSDNTHLTFTLATICDIATIYGSCAGGFHFKKFTYDVKDTYEMLLGKKEFKGYPKYEAVADKSNPFNKYNLDTKKIITAYNYQTAFSGTMIGGNLDCLQLICGTKFDKMAEYSKAHTEGIIFYLEACDLSVLSIKRALIQLKRANWFSNIKGFLIGRPLCIDQELFGIDHINACVDVLNEFNVPILLDIDLGHLAPSLPFKNNVYATVALEKNNIFIEYKE